MLGVRCAFDATAWEPQGGAAGKTSEIGRWISPRSQRRRRLFCPIFVAPNRRGFFVFFSKQMVFHFVSESEFTWVACHWRNQIVGVLFGAFTRSLTVSPAFRSKFGQLLVCSAHGWVSFHVPCHACQLANPLTTLSPFATGAAVSEREIRRLLPRALAAPLPVGAPCCRGARSGG